MDKEPEENEGLELDEADFLKARIDNISVSNLGFIVFLKAEGDLRVLPIFIGANEAHSIAIAFNNQVPPRPLTHDLLKNILGLLDVEVVKIQVTALSENTFYGRIHLRKEGIEEMDIDARPSDAIALALRYKVPIFVHKNVYESAAIQVKETGSAEEVGDETDTLLEEALTPARKDPVETVKEKLNKALEAEHYEEAAKLRDELRRLQSGN
ncbi:MAG TPA: bifunctional nuclease family protein [Fibrobacteria bacterium]|nr:bifunctional nuclease family protein [Fibrobacteria bacterium]